MDPTAIVNSPLDPEQRAERLARFYDLDVLDLSYDAELYQELTLMEPGPILELGVGSGRVGIPLALAGNDIMGIDSDVAMLERAAREWERVRGELDVNRFRVREGDFYSYRGDSRFAMVFLAINTILLAEDDAARLAILTTMHANLRARGLAIAEFSTPQPDELAGYDGRLQLEWLRQDPETGEQVTKGISARYDLEANTLALTQIYEFTPPSGGPLGRVAKTDTLHLVTAEHFAGLAEQAGFGDVELRGDHLPTPHGARSHRAILIARLV